MTTLTDFLLARIAEDEDQADQNAAVFSGFLNGKQSRGQLECEARRRILELHSEPGHECIDRSHGVPIYPVSDAMTLHGVPVPGCATLRLLSLPYADHPDYRQEWRP